MKLWEECPNADLIALFITAAQHTVATSKKPARPPGWVTGKSVRMWSRLNKKGDGPQLSHDLSKEMSIGFTRSGASADDGRRAAVAVGLMVWPESMRAFVGMTQKERNAMLRVGVSEELGHQLALATLYHRILKRYERLKGDDS